MSALSAWQGEPVVDIEWLPGDAAAQSLVENRIAIAHPDWIGIHQPENSQPLEILEPEAVEIVGIAINPAGSWLISGSLLPKNDAEFISSLEGWRRPSADPNSAGEWQHVGVINRLSGPGFTALAFSPDGSRLFTTYTGTEPNQEGAVYVWQVSSWGIIEVLETGTILGVAVSGESTLLAMSPNRYQIDIRDLVENELRYRLHTSFTGAVSSLVFSPDSLVLATGHYDGTIRLWNTLTGEEFMTIPAGGIVASLAFSPDGMVLASGDGDQDYQVRLWSVNTGTLLRGLPGHEHAVDHLLFSPDGSMLISGSHEGSIRIWGIVP